MQKLTVLLVVILLSIGCEAQKNSYAVRMAETIIKMHPDSIVVKKYITHGPDEQKIEEKIPSRPATWNYEQGVVLKGFERLWKHTGDRKYFDYMKKMMDIFIKSDGAIRTYELLDYNLDNIGPGPILLVLYKETKEEKYKRAADRLREQLEWQPRTKEGGYWHKHRYPYQMWLDGLYMAGPFEAEYTSLFGASKHFDDVIRQFVWMEAHARDAKTGLIYHGWDESKQQRWANKTTGNSPEFWSRAMGWYAMAIVEVLDYLPENHNGRKELIAILDRLAQAVKKYQDEKTGVWFQVTDKASVHGNYVEASGSCMFVYALAKASRLGYIDKSFSEVAKKGFDGIVKNFITTDESNNIHLTKTCSGAGLGGDPYRDGSFEYYIKEPLRIDDLKGVGPFIQAAIEMELMSNKKQAGK